MKKYGMKKMGLHLSLTSILKEIGEKLQIVWQIFLVKILFLTLVRFMQ